MKKVLRAIAVMALAVSPALASGTVWVVSSSGPHTTIQAAIDLAADGDTILIKTGTYAGFTITDKALSVVADTNQTVTITSQVIVQDLATFRTVVVGGLNLSPPDWPASGGLLLRDNDGPVRVQSCTISSSSVNVPAQNLGVVQVYSCVDVIFVRCSFTGGPGLGSSGTWVTAGTGWPGLRSVASSLGAFDCTITGGLGGNGGFLCGHGGRGGNGAIVQGGYLFASGSTLRGGQGGAGGGQSSCLNCVATGPGMGGPGGTGLAISAQAHAELLGCTTTGGAFGQQGCTPCECSGWWGTAGLAIDNPALATILPGPARKLTAPLVVRENTLTTIAFAGSASDGAHLLAGGTTSFAFNPATQGLLVVNDLRRMVWSYYGVMPGTGTLVSSLAIPALPATVDTRTRFLQAAMIDTGGQITLGSPSCLVIVGAGF